MSNSVDAEKFDELDELYNQTVQGIAEVDYFMYSTGFVGTKETADGLRVSKGTRASVKGGRVEMEGPRCVDKGSRPVHAPTIIRCLGGKFT